MPEVDLTIVAKNQEFLKTMSDSQKAEGDFYADWQKNMNLTAEQHESIMKGMQDELKRLGVSEEDYLKKYKQVSDGQKGILEQLQEDLRIFKELKKSATTTEDIEKFNKKINETQKEFDKLNGSSKKSTDTFDKLKSGFVKLFAVIGGGYAIMQGVKKAIASTGDSADWFNKKLTQAKYATDLFLKSLVSGGLTNFSRNLDNVVAAAGRYADKINEIKNLRRSQEVQDSASNIEVQKLLKISDDVNLSYDKRIDALKEASRLEKENINVKTKLAGETLKNELDIMSNLSGLTYKQLDQYIKEYSSLSNLIEVGKKYNEVLAERDKYQRVITRGGIIPLSITTKVNELNSELEKMGTSAEAAGKLTVKFGKETEAEYDKLAQAYKDFNGARAESDEKTRRMEARLANLIKEREDERLRKKKETDDKIKKQHEEFLKLLEDLNKRYQEAQLEGLTGKKRINAEEDFALLELSNLKANLEAKGKLTKEQLTMIEYIETSIAKKGVLERKKIDIEENLNRATSKRELIDVLLKNAEDEIDLTRLAEDEKLKLRIAAVQHAIEMYTKLGDTESLVAAENLKKYLKGLNIDLEDATIEKEFDFEEWLWKSMGVDTKTPKGAFMAKWMTTYANSIVESLGTILDAEAELASQRRQNAENRISELESQLEEELDLQEQGLANNVNAVKKEIEQTKAEKQKAFEQEKQIQQAQMVLDTVTQVSSLITASANIFKAFSKIPIIGVPLAWAAIASMFGLMAVAKVKAAKASKMEQGGFIDEYGVIKGKRHNEGGEPLNNHIEVEQGEGVGVFNRNATQYYGGMLPKWVQSINNRNFPKFDIRPEIKANQTFDLKTSTMNSELKAIRTGIDNLNHNMLNQSQTNHKQGVRIEKQGNRTRIIHESN